MTKIVLAFDKSVYGDAEELCLSSLHGVVDVVKVGLEAITALQVGQHYGHSVADDVASYCENAGIGIFWDQKICDIRNTVERSLENICARPGVAMTTVMACVSEDALRAAAEVCSKHGVIALAVTVLTDINTDEGTSIFGDVPGHKVLQFARRAKKCGFGGLVCSPRELAYLRENRVDLTLVVPGIRPTGAALGDQKRVMTPREAAQLGADYLVIGRPIMDAPDPHRAALAIRDELA